MNYSTFEISALWHWIERLFVYQADSPLMMGSIPFALLFIFFLAIYTLLKSYSRTAMMMYVICFSLFFAYKVNGMVMWMLPLTACINYAVTQEIIPGNISGIMTLRSACIGEAPRSSAAS